MNQKAVILCVDDELIDLSLLEAVLVPRGYQTVLVQDGETALATLRNQQIDLVLLDVMMPDMDGFALLRQIKTDRHSSAIPVLFVTSLQDTDSEIKGLELGAADYLIKPIVPAVLMARLQTHLALKAHRDRMEELAKDYARQITHTERLSTLGTLTAGIAHEINSPVVYALGFANALLTDMQKLAGRITSSESGKTELLAACGIFFAKGIDRAARVVEGITRIRDIMEAMRKFVCHEQAEKTIISLDTCIDNALALCHNELKYHVTVHKEVATELSPVMANGRQLEQVFVNLFKNAADAMDRNQKGVLDIGLRRVNGCIRCSIENNGPGITPALLETIWEPFFSTKGPESGTGLGLSVSRGIIKSHQGRIWAENRELNAGVRFVVEIPVAQAEQGNERDRRPLRL
jgi:signal transduction histidine kinase